MKNHIQIKFRLFFLVFLVLQKRARQIRVNRDHGHLMTIVADSEVKQLLVFHYREIL
jgi:hypothetical protein